MELKTERLVIREVTYEEAKQISEQNSGNFANTLLDSLSEDDVAIIFNDKEPSIALTENIGALLQEPKSEAEKLLIRIYHITKLSMDARQAHCFSNFENYAQDLV